VFTRFAAVASLQERNADGLIVSGAETDVCVLSTVLDAVDLGYRVIVVKTPCSMKSTPRGFGARDEPHSRYAPPSPNLGDVRHP
jgi:nicotinamidase-related amidase